MSKLMQALLKIPAGNNLRVLTAIVVGAFWSSFTTTAQWVDASGNLLATMVSMPVNLAHLPFKAH
ncbi:MAG: hypothetical protein H0A76_09880 [Candidatus Thiodubiliella endoseptemdiera]|uniref:Uncharacterized protein n=1 Tax=Candidatus Thiodubiliella endoseptemdiera TaxID=2738886 RepID=A0A853F925_9GAMM|nr:hypothetical protein [Candidatus Thiodubiliella endoseptemdiera]